MKTRQKPFCYHVSMVRRIKFNRTFTTHKIKQYATWLKFIYFHHNLNSCHQNLIQTSKNHLYIYVLTKSDFPRQSAN